MSWKAWKGKYNVSDAQAVFCASLVKAGSMRSKTEGRADPYSGVRIALNIDININIDVVRYFHTFSLISRGQTALEAKEAGSTFTLTL